MSFVTNNNIERVISTFQEAIPKCVVCAENAKTPVILKCGHIFCAHCLRKCPGKDIRKRFCPKCGYFQIFQSFSYPSLPNMTDLSDLLNCVQKQSGYDGQNNNMVKTSDKNNQVMPVLFENVDPINEHLSLSQENVSTFNSSCSHRKFYKSTHSKLNTQETIKHSEELIKERVFITNVIKRINLLYEPFVAKLCCNAIISVLDESTLGDQSAILQNADQCQCGTNISMSGGEIQCPHCQHKFNLKTENPVLEILSEKSFQLQSTDNINSEFICDGSDSEPETEIIPVEKILRKNTEKNKDNGVMQKIISCENIKTRTLFESDRICDIDASDDDLEIIDDNSDIEIIEEIVNPEITVREKYKSPELGQVETAKNEVDDVDIVEVSQNEESEKSNAENLINKNSLQKKHSVEIGSNSEFTITSGKRCRISLEKRFERCEMRECKNDSKKLKLNSSLEINENDVKKNFNVFSNQGEQHEKNVQSFSSQSVDVTVIDAIEDELFSTCDMVGKTYPENITSRIQSTPGHNQTGETVCNLNSFLSTGEGCYDSSDNNQDFLNKILTVPPEFQDHPIENNLTDNSAERCPINIQYSSVRMLKSAELNINYVKINSSKESFDQVIATENILTSFDDPLGSIVLSSQNKPEFSVPSRSMVYPEKESTGKKNNSLILKESGSCSVLSGSNSDQRSIFNNFCNKSNSNQVKVECESTSSFVFNSHNVLVMATNTTNSLSSEIINSSKNVEQSICVACSSLDEIEMGKVAEFCTVFKLNYNPVDKSNITHLIMAVDDLNKIIGATVKYFYAISGGRWILNMNWVYDSLEQGHLANEVYEATTSGLVKDVLRGYNATVFAYGATGAGKTHTMVGDTREPGIMVRALNDLFKAVAESGHSEHFAVTMSCLEIYNEQIRDLLNPSSGYLELREDSKGKNIQVAGLTELSTNSTDQVMQLLQKANRARTVEPTAVNKTSSRSHALVSVTVKQNIPANFQDSSSQFVNSIRQGRLFMIDLAGSERANKTKNRGKRLQEGAHINRSLLALGNCINALSGGAKYVNYRDSKLTRLLKDALSGNCKTVMVANISPAAIHKEETRNTLIYADRANRISTKAGSNVLDVNYHVTQYQTVISELRNEITRLKTKMQEERPRSGHAEKLTASQKNNEVKNLREQIVTTFKEQMRLRRKLMEIDSQLLGLSMDAERQHMIISNWESRNNKLYKNTRNQNSRAHTQQSIRRRQTASSNASEPEYTSDGEVEGEMAVQQAWAELADVEKDQERWHDERIKTEQELEHCRQHGVSLEDELPSRISTDDERELLALLCRVHELEADKMALQSERIARMHELRRRDTALLRLERQRQLSDAIITRQRQLMEEGRMNLPPDLQELYQMYQQEIHAATYADHNLFFLNSPDKLPSIGRGLYTSDSLFSRRRSPDSEGTAPSSADSDYAMSPLPPLNEVVTQSSAVEDRLMGHLVPPPSRSRVKFPPISTASSLPSKLPKSVTTQGTHIKRSSSDLNITTLDNTS